jgi:hypothetical protein
MSDKQHSDKGADDRAHGTHGKGDTREQKVDPVVSEPGVDASEPHFSDAGWGSAASGGSVIDKRPPKDKKGA